MFERFTERARQVVVLAQDEARALAHGYIGTEHLLLGILREEEGLGARVLSSLGVTIDDARERVARIVGRGDEVPASQIPFTPHAKAALELSLREALSLGHNHIGTEHILLGLVRANNGVAAQVLDQFGAHAGKVRDTIILMMGGRISSAPRSAEVNVDEMLESSSPTLWTGYGDMGQEVEADPPPLPPPEPVLLRGILIGWSLFAAASGIGLLVGWLIWG